MTKSIPQEDTHPQLFEKAEPGGSELRGDCKTNTVTRRKILQHAGQGVAAGVLSSTLGRSAVAEIWTPSYDGDNGKSGSSSRKPQISLIIDDGSPVDPMYYMHPGYDTPFLPSVAFYQRVADLMDRFELHGKMTVLPMPSCLGRIDQTVKRVPQQHLESFLKIVRERIAPRFDITPEFLTHQNAYDLKAGNAQLIAGGGYQHVFEDVWLSGASTEEAVEYFCLAFTILKNVGINPTGMTSPWVAGIDVERKYAEALSTAQWRTFGQHSTWYFLHGSDWGAPQQCSLGYESPDRDRVVVSVPANFPDLFWSMDLPGNQRQKFITDNIDRVISPDGRTGRLRQLIESGYPVTFLTHWQSLYTQGTELGLEGLNALLERIQKEYGKSLEWVTCSERMRGYSSSAKLGA
jgi:hypothetical protein